MYSDYIKTQNEAICHLFLHCCFKDGKFSSDEVDNVSSKFVTLQIDKDLNFKEEIHHYRAYQNEVFNEDDYLTYIFKLINPVNDLALYSYCTELCLSDGLLSTEEETLLDKIAAELQIGDEQKTIDNLITQRKAVEMEKIF